MPNWCYNDITIHGPADDLQRFMDAVTLPENDGAKTSMGEDAGDYDFSLLYPTPKELADTTAGFFSPEPHPNWAVMLAKGEMTQEWHDELVRNNAEGWQKFQDNIAKYGYKDWYDWNCDNWGTKWSPRIDSLALDAANNAIQGRYDTAWSPATGLLTKISEQFPSLIFKVTFEEESNAFIGSEIFFQGNVFEVSYDPANPEGYPEQFKEQVTKVLNTLRENDWDFDSDEYHAYLDLQSVLRDATLDEAQANFLRKFPGAYAEL